MKRICLFFSICYFFVVVAFGFTVISFSHFRVLRAKCIYLILCIIFSFVVTGILKSLSHHVQAPQRYTKIKKKCKKKMIIICSICVSLTSVGIFVYNFFLLLFWSFFSVSIFIVIVFRGAQSAFYFVVWCTFIQNRSIALQFHHFLVLEKHMHERYYYDAINVFNTLLHHLTI